MSERTGPPLEEQILAQVLADKPGEKIDPQRVLDIIDQFCYKHWMMNVGDVKGKVLDEEILKHKPQLLLELGCYIGYSSTRMARLLPDGAKLISVEASEDNAKIARQIHAKCGVDSKVEIIVATAESAIPTLQAKATERGRKFDLVFIDHAKYDYENALKRIEQADLLRSGSVVIADNVVVFGDAVAGYLNHVRNSGLYKSVLHEATVEYDPNTKDGVEVSIKL